jgi:GT2 family glycosyltransferase
VPPGHVKVLSLSKSCAAEGRTGVTTHVEASVDIIIPVYRGLRHVRACLHSLLTWTNTSHRLIVVDDASDEHTSTTVQRLVADGWGERGTVLRNDVNLGFLRTANRGMRAGSAPVIVLLNSDTLVTPGWLDGLVTSLDHDPTVGISSPLSNNANMTRISVPYGSHHLEIAEALRRISPRSYPDIRLATGFCLAARRSLVEELDFFDERYGRGYFEEADLCLRAAELGWRTIADDATYVHHHGWGSFGAEERNLLMKQNEELFHQRWGEGAHKRLRREILDRQLFAEHERRLRLALRGSAQVSPRRQLPRSGTRNVAERARRAGERPRGHARLATWTRHHLDHWHQIAHGASTAVPPQDARDALFLVDDLTITPFTTDLLQLLDRLMQQGLQVGLATSGAFDTALFTDPCRLRPYVLTGPDELLEVLPPSRVVVPTSPRTVFDALLLRQRDGASVAAWLEPQSVIPSTRWPEDGWAPTAAPMLAQAHLGTAPAWLPAPVRPAFHEVPLGVDSEVYEPAPLDGRHRSVLLTHWLEAGPDATDTVRQAVELLHAADIDPIVYGDPLPDGGAHSEPLSPQEIESTLLARHAAVMEITPLPGLHRLRLRCAATGTPLILAAPGGSADLLRVGVEAHGAPRGDARRAVEIATTIVDEPQQAAERVVRGLERASSRPTEIEARALADALRAVADRESH